MLALHITMALAVALSGIVVFLESGIAVLLESGIGCSRSINKHSSKATRKNKYTNELVQWHCHQHQWHVPWPCTLPWH